MVTTSTGVRAEARSDKGSVPRRNVFYSAVAVDALGSGLWLPFSLIFFTRAQGIPLREAGLALTLGSVFGLLVGLRSGALVDAYGPGRLTLASNGVRAVCFALYPLVHSVGLLVPLVVVNMGADRVFWTANSPMLASFASGRALERMVARLGSLRLLGLGLGAGVSGLLATSRGGLHLVALVNAASFASAGVLLAVALAAGGRRSAPGAAPSPAVPAVPGQASPVWRDRPYVALCAWQASTMTVATSLVVILPLVAVGVMGGPDWLPGASIVAGNVVLTVTQPLGVRLAERTSRSTVLVVAATCLAVAMAPMSLGSSLGPALVVVTVFWAATVGALGESLAVPIMIVAANDAAPERMRGRYSAVFQTGWGAASAAGPALFAVLLGVSNALLWLFLAAVAAAAIPAVGWLERRLPDGVLSGRASSDAV